MVCCIVLPLLIPNDIQPRVVLQEIPQIAITEASLQIIFLKFHENLVGVNELSYTTIIQWDRKFTLYWAHWNYRD